MIKRWHNNNSNQIEICKAQPGNCPFGDRSPHVEAGNRFEADAKMAEYFASESDTFSTAKKSSRVNEDEVVSYYHRAPVVVSRAYIESNRNRDDTTKRVQKLFDRAANKGAAFYEMDSVWDDEKLEYSSGGLKAIDSGALSKHVFRSVTGDKVLSTHTESSQVAIVKIKSFLDKHGFNDPSNYEVTKATETDDLGESFDSYKVAPNEVLRAKMSNLVDDFEGFFRG